MAIIRLSDEEVFSVDSVDYHVLHNACVEGAKVIGGVVEIGSRRGGSAKIMMDAFASVGAANKRPFFCIDPYGNIETQLTHLNLNKFYKHKITLEDEPDSKELSKGIRLDYTNEMRNRVVPSLYYYAFQKGFNFTFFFLEDTEFFARYPDGVPLYDEEKMLCNQYATVFYDGPHTDDAVMAEVLYFQDRTVVGSTSVFDDIWQYSHDELIEPWLFAYGWELLEKTETKASYRRFK